MILHHYYRAENLICKSRFDITQSAGHYERFERLLLNARNFNVGGLSFNHCPRPQSFNSHQSRAAESILSKGSANISSIFCPDLHHPRLGYFDVKGTNDAGLFLMSEDGKTIELFLACGYKGHEQALYQQAAEGELAAEMQRLRATTCPRLKEAPQAA